jgi:hypothetical protein
MFVYILFRSQMVPKPWSWESEFISVFTSGKDANEELKKVAVVELPDMMVPWKKYASKDGASKYWVDTIDLEDEAYLKCLYCWRLKRKK